MKTARIMQAIGFAFVSVLLVASLCAAQVSTSNITGTVTDKQGLVVAGAKVVAKNEATAGRFKFLTRAIKRLRNEMADKELPRPARPHRT